MVRVLELEKTLTIWTPHTPDCVFVVYPTEAAKISNVNNFERLREEKSIASFREFYGGLAHAQAVLRF